jgi:hypothetical protein
MFLQTQVQELHLISIGSIGKKGPTQNHTIMASTTISLLTTLRGGALIWAIWISPKHVVRRLENRNCGLDARYLQQD